MGRLLKKRIDRKKKPNIKSSDAQVSDKPLSTSGIGSIDPPKKAQQPLIQRKQPSEVKNGYVEKSIQFLREVRAELKKVTWPSRKQTMGSTIVVLILVVLISSFLGIVDMGLAGILRLVIP